MYDLDDQKETSNPKEQVNEVLLEQLVSMGFSVEGCKKALISTRNNDIEAAMNWVFEHQSDPDFDKPYQATTKSTPIVRLKIKINISLLFY